MHKILIAFAIILVTSAMFLSGFFIYQNVQNYNYKTNQKLMESKPELQQLPEFQLKEEPKEEPEKVEPVKLTYQIKDKVNVPVLMYHHIDDLEGIPANDSIGIGLRVGPSIFEKQLINLKDRGYTTINSFDLYKYIKQEKELPTKPILLTFDDGYQDNYDNAYKLLQKYNMVGDFGIITSKVGENEFMTWEELAEMVKNGMSISSHTVHHCYLANDNADRSGFLPTPIDETENQDDVFFNSYIKLTSGQVRKELKDSKETLEEKLNIHVSTLIYPFGKWNKTTEQIAKEEGYNFAFTTQGQNGEQDLTTPFDMPRYRVFGQQSGNISGFFGN